MAKSQNQFHSPPDEMRRWSKSENNEWKWIEKEKVLRDLKSEWKEVQLITIVHKQSQPHPKPKNRIQKRDF